MSVPKHQIDKDVIWQMLQPIPIPTCQGRSYAKQMTNHEYSAEQVNSRPGRVQAQTTREWVYEYSYGGKVWPAIWGDPPEGYRSVPDDFDPKFKTSNSGEVKTKARVRIRI